MNDWAMYLSQISAVYMFGVIWLIQLIHYPSFKFISPSRFSEFHNKHTSRMVFLVGPVMVAELISAVGLAFKNFNSLSLANLIIVILLWGFTFLISVPLHNRLAAGFNPEIIQKLIVTNWPRTVLWTVRGVLIIYIIP